MANVSFKRGLAANLAAAGFTAQDGVFYLTTDTHRLYVGQGSELVDLNRYIKYVDTQSGLGSKAAVGDFAFVADGNMLCVYDGKNWTQINPQDGNDISRISSITTPTVSANDSGITVSFTVNQTITDKNGTSKADGAGIPVSFKINASDLTTANKVAIGLAATANTTAGIDLATSGSGATGNKINIKGGDNATVALSDGAVVVSAKDTTYTLGGADNAIKITNSSGTAQSLPVVSGSKITATVADNKLTIAHANLAAANEVAGEGISLDEGKSFKVVTGITAADGHVTSYSTETVTVPDYSDTKYHMEVAAGANQATLNLTDNNDTKSPVTIKAGTDVAVTGDATGAAVTVEHKAYAAVTPTANAAANIDATYGEAFTVLDSVTTNNGHVTGITTKQVKMPSQLKDGIAGVDVSANDSGDISVKVTDQTGANKTGTASGALYMTVNGAKVYNQGSIDFYTKSEIDSKMNGIDAMRYKGTVGGTGATVTALPSTGVAVGDTYMAAEKGTYGGHSCDAGDLLIATGTEANGVITTGLAWTYVPSGDDTDTQFTLQVAANKITLKNSTAGTDAGVVTIAAGNKMNVATSGNTITVSHTSAAPTATEGAISPEHGGSFTVLDSITAEDGHVSAYTTKKITLPTVKSTKGKLDLLAGHKINYSDADGGSQSVTLDNGDGYITLTDDLTTDKITIGHAQYAALSVTSDKTGLNLAHGGKFNVITGVTRDNGGHLTGYTTKEYVLPADKDTTYTVTTAESTDSGLIKLTASSGSSTQAKIAGGTAVTVTGAATGITVAHADVASSKSSTTETPTAGSKVTVVKDVTVNAQGHATGVKTVEITLPVDKDTTYTMNSTVAAAGNGAKFTANLVDSNNSNKGTANLTINSNSLNVAASANTMTIEMEWGSF